MHAAGIGAARGWLRSSARKTGARRMTTVVWEKYCRAEGSDDHLRLSSTGLCFVPVSFFSMGTGFQAASLRGAAGSTPKSQT